MKVPTHVIGLYHKSVRRYRKIIARIRKNHDNSSYQYRILINALRKLRKKIADLHFQLKIALASGVLGLSLSVNPTNAQTNTHPFTLQLLTQIIDRLFITETIKEKAHNLILRSGHP